MIHDLEHLRRVEFPLTVECAFLNHAASSPLPQRSADVLVSGCYKWLLGIPGTAVMYVRRDAMPRFLLTAPARRA